jgi:hypothetical protein
MCALSSSSVAISVAVMNISQRVVDQALAIGYASDLLVRFTAINNSSIWLCEVELLSVVILVEFSTCW